MQASSESPRITVSAPTTCAQRLNDIANLPRPEYVQAVKALLASEWQRIQTHQARHINEVTGFDVAASLTAVVDGLITAFAKRSFARAKAPADWNQRVGIYALGSYGRGELSPSSDIDLLVFDCDKGIQPEWVADGNNGLQTLLWDAGFTVGGSLRQLGELEPILADDFVTATAVIEQRSVVSSERVDEVFTGVRERFRNKRGKAFLAYKIQELMERRGNLDISLLKLEPNLKSDPGAMRDVQLLRNIAFVLYGSRNLHALRELDVMSWEDIQGLFSANDHFLGTRCLLHFHHQKGQDVMTLTDQLWLAEMLGYTGSGRLMAVEHMMRRHYEKTLHVHRTVELVRHRLLSMGHLGRRRLLIKSRRKVGEHFSSIGGQVYLSNRDFWQRPDACRQLFDMCLMTQERGLRLSLELQRTIAGFAYLFDHSEVRNDHCIGRTLLNILGNIGNVKPIVEDMHYAGMLGAYLPEWSRLTCHMQFNSYHQYTVDQHTIIALGYIDAVAKGDHPGLRGMRHILQANPRQNGIFMLALLLHDMGKFMGSGHVARGALMVSTVAQRMGLTEAEEDLLYFLVAEHVTLSDATRSRDIHEPRFVAALADTVGDQRRLDLLYSLTFADARAVGEGVMTSWQEAILEELHDTVTQTIGVQNGRESMSRPQIVREQLSTLGLSSEASEQYLANFPQGYVYQVRREEVVQHYHLLQQAANQICGCQIDRNNGTTTVMFATKNRSGLLAELAAAMSANALQIVEARIWTTEDELSMFSIRVQTSSDGEVSSDVWERLQADLHQAADGTLDPDQQMTRELTRVEIIQPADSGFDQIEVTTDQHNSADATVVDVRVKNAPGLLVIMCRTIFEQNCSIEYASIATYGDIARDAFYVQQNDAKLTVGAAASLRDALTTRLRAELEADNPALERKVPHGAISF